MSSFGASSLFCSKISLTQLIHPSSSLSSDLVHPFCANLYFHQFTVRTYHRRVDRLISVLLRQRDIVLEPFRNRLVELCDNPVRDEAVVVILGIEDEADGKKIVNLIERFLATKHF